MMLPDEILGLIFSFVADKTAEPTAQSKKDFASLALTTKRFLPLARACLYFRPIVPSQFLTWKKALALESSLSSGLGELVVSLEGIVEFVCGIGTLAEPSSLAFQLRGGYTKTFSLYFVILKACTRLVCVELLFNSTRHLKKLLLALEPSTSTLRTVIFKNSRSRSSNGYYVTMRDVVAALKHDQLDSIENVSLESIRRPIDRFQSGFPTAASLLGFSTSRALDSDTLQSFLPCDTSRLSAATVVLSAELNPADVTWFWNYLPSQLERLHLRSLADSQRMADLETYLERNTFALPVSEFSRLTCLRRLTLQGFSGPSLELVRCVASSCPNLRSLDFSDSKWIIPASSDRAAPKDSDSYQKIIEPEDLLASLLSFNHLEEANLGFLPTLYFETYDDVVDAMKDQGGVLIEWMPRWIQARCERCGGRH
ncbi:hypothetical protein JCM3766R1_000978 [Sporobolomyces carnicolor]